MTKRGWFYLAVAIILVGEIVAFNMVRIRQSRELADINDQATAHQEKDLTTYLDRQTDDRKLVRLAKLLARSQSSVLRPIIDRAYALNPKSRDITLLASSYHPELKDQVTKLDPLYGQITPTP